jgi:hypothetical protein
VAKSKLTAPNGAKVSVDSKRVDSLLRYGFTKPSETKAPAKKAASEKSEKS